MGWTRRVDLTASVIIILILFASLTLYAQRVRELEISDAVTLAAIVLLPQIIIILIGFFIGIAILRATGRKSLW